MPQLIKGPEREQLALFELRIEDMIEAESEVRVIDKFVEVIDLEEMGFTKSKLNTKGTNHYDAKDLLKLYLYGYRHKTRSSRKLAELCRTNVEVIWLLRGICPDFRTISEFRKENASKIKEVFKETVRMSAELGLISKKQSQDGVKIRAVNGKERNYTLNKIDERIKRAEESIERYLKKLDKVDNKEEKIEEEKEELEKIIEEKKKVQEELEKIRKEMEESKVSQKSLTDPESRLMKTNGGFQVCYNNQVVVDAESHIVTNYNVDNNPADIGTMTDVMEELKEMLGIDEVMVDITDKGYKDREDMSKCLEAGIIPEVTLGKNEREYEVSFPYEEREITEEIRRSEKAEDIKKCLRSGVIPKVYEEYLSDIKVEEKEKCETKEEIEQEESKIVNVNIKMHKKGNLKMYKKRNGNVQFRTQNYRYFQELKYL